MDFNTFINLLDSKKLFLCEINVGDKIHDDGWTQHGSSTNCYYTGYTFGFPNKITEDDNDLTERFSLSECNSNVHSFYYDFQNQVLYLHITGASDPGSQTGSDYDYTIISYCWLYYCNLQDTNYPVIYPRQQERLTDGNLEQWDSAIDLTKWTENIAGTSTVNRESAVVYTGGYSCRLDIDGSNSDASIYQDIKLKPGAECKLSLYRKMSAAAKTGKVRIRDSGSNVYLNSAGNWQAGVTSISLSNQTSWTKFALAFYAHADYDDYRITISNSTSADASIYLDDVSLLLYREENLYLPYLKSEYLPSISQGVGDYHVGDIRMQSGTIGFINNEDGYWYNAIQNRLWDKKSIDIKFNKVGAAYADFETIFHGKTKTPVVNNIRATIGTIDDKILIYKEIPATKYWISNYTNLEDGVEGLPIPIIYGEVENILPICIDTTIYKYKIAIHELESIIDVYKDDAALTGGGVDYTADAANGEFTLTADPGDSVISCDVQGKKCDIEDGTYSTNVADILFDILTSYTDIKKEQIDYDSFLDLRGGRTQEHHLYLGESKSVLTILRRLQQSALFHLIPTGSKLGAFRYKTGVESGTPRLLDEDYSGFTLFKDTSSIYKKVKIRYDYDPGNISYSRILKTNVAAEYKHDAIDTKTITTSLRLEAEAENIGAFYIDVLSDPRNKVKTKIRTIGFKLSPAKKVILNKTQGDLTIFNEAPYRVLEVQKNLSSGQVNITAWEDLQSAGDTYCEVCYECQSCNTIQAGTCETCYSCESCDSGECDDCQSCYYCETCDTGECTACETCDTCENCNTCETNDVCPACESCQSCITCEVCDTGECSSCQICDTCEKCNTGECSTCETCDTCEKCNTGECASCQTCDACQQCNTGECTTCETCDVCQLCDTCENRYSCPECDVCQTCNTCEACNTGECTACETCDVCQACDSGECSTCETCDTCEKCDTGECVACMVCNLCEICVTTCQTCVLCELCDATYA